MGKRRLTFPGVGNLTFSRVPSLISSYDLSFFPAASVMFENPRRGRQARNFTTNVHVPKILDLKSSSEQIFSVNCRWVPLIN